jgi:xylulokinase
VDVLAENGLVLGEVRVAGDRSRSRLWCEILADVLHRDLSPITQQPGASYGAAVLAGIGTGLLDRWDEVADTVVRGEVVSPRRENVARYEERYQQFRQLSAQTASVAHSLARDAP